MLSSGPPTSHSLLPHWGPDSEAPENGSKWLPLAKSIWFVTKKHSLPSSEPKLQFHAFKLFFVSYSTSALFLTSRSIWGSWNWSEMIPPTAKHWYDTKIMSQARSEQKLQFHSMRSFWASYRPSTLFLAFRSIWGSWKLSQMISHAQKHGVWHQNQGSSMLRSWVTPHTDMIKD